MKMQWRMISAETIAQHKYIYISRFTYLTYVMINNIEYSSLSIANCVCYTPRLWSTVCETCDQTHTAFVRFICCCVFCCSFAHRTEPQKKKDKATGWNECNECRAIYCISRLGIFIWRANTCIKHVLWMQLTVRRVAHSNRLSIWLSTANKKASKILTTKSDASSTKMQ